MVCKSAITIVLAIIVMSASVILAAYSELTGKPANADEIISGLLEAVIDVNYSNYRSYFAVELQDQLETKQEFIEEVALIQDTYGDYVANSMSYLGVETIEDGQIRVYYNAEFTKISDIQIKTVFEKRVGETVVVGF